MTKTREPQERPIRTREDWESFVAHVGPLAAIEQWNRQQGFKRELEISWNGRSPFVHVTRGSGKPQLHRVRRGESPFEAARKIALGHRRTDAARKPPRTRSERRPREHRSTGSRSLRGPPRDDDPDQPPARGRGRPPVSRQPGSGDERKLLDVPALERLEAALRIIANDRALSAAGRFDLLAAALWPSMPAEPAA